MARLFVTPREIDLISDLTKEITKDIIGQKIYYYHVRVEESEVHDVYEEAERKVFDPAVEIDARLEWQAKDIRTDKFGHEGIYSITCYMHYRDVIDKGLHVNVGDYFSFGDNFFEITSSRYDSIIFGQIEHVTGYVLQGKMARKGLIDEIPFGPTEEIYTDADAVQEEFTQQRGFSIVDGQETGDVRQLQKDGKLSKPISGPAKVKKSPNGSKFYGDS